MIGNQRQLNLYTLGCTKQDFPHRFRAGIAIHPDCHSFAHQSDVPGAFNTTIVQANAAAADMMTALVKLLYSNKGQP
jgi:hypothetical protein